MPKVSVIIPTYNRAQVVGEAVDSVLAQTYRDHEVIVVDDGSTDGTGEVMHNYVARFAERVSYLRQRNVGAPAARNAGLRAATGEYVAFLDSDDVYLPRRLEVGAGALEDDPHCGASYVDAQTVDAQGTVLLHSRVRRFGGPASGWILPALLRGDPIQTNAITIRRSVLDEVGLFEEKLWSGQDTDLWWRIAKRYPMRGLPEVLVVIREFESSLSRGLGRPEDRLKRLSIWIEGQSRYLGLWTDLPFPTRRLLARRIWGYRHEEARLLLCLGRAEEVPAVRARMRELEREFHLRLHTLRCHLGQRLPSMQRVWSLVRDARMNRQQPVIFPQAGQR